MIHHLISVNHQKVLSKLVVNRYCYLISEPQADIPAVHAQYIPQPDEPAAPNMAPQIGAEHGLCARALYDYQAGR